MITMYTWQKIKQLYNDGKSKKGIAKELKISRNIVFIIAILYSSRLKKSQVTGHKSQVFYIQNHLFMFYLLFIKILIKL